jgi:hypothetical protein
MSALASDDPDTVPVPGNVGEKPALYLPRRYRSDNIPLYLCNPLPEPMVNVVIVSLGTSLALGASTSSKERHFARVEPNSCLLVDALDPYIDAEMVVLFSVTARVNGEVFEGRTAINHWPGKEGVHFRLHPPPAHS